MVLHPDFDAMWLGEQLRILREHREQPVQRAGRLVLVQPELEVHAHDREVAS